MDCTALHYTALHCTALHCTALHYTALHCTALHCAALHCTALHCTALHYTALPCPAMYCTSLNFAQLTEYPHRYYGTGRITHENYVQFIRWYRYNISNITITITISINSLALQAWCPGLWVYRPEQELCSPGNINIGAKLEKEVRVDKTVLLRSGRITTLWSRTGKTSLY